MEEPSLLDVLLYLIRKGANKPFHLEKSRVKATRLQLKIHDASKTYIRQFCGIKELAAEHGITCFVLKCGRQVPAIGKNQQPDQYRINTQDQWEIEIEEIFNKNGVLRGELCK